MICQERKQMFPAELISPLRINDDSREVCGICALKLIRSAHGDPTHQFARGSVARSLYLRAVEHLARREK